MVSIFFVFIASLPALLDQLNSPGWKEMLSWQLCLPGRRAGAGWRAGGREVGEG